MKVKIPVYITATISRCIGEVEVENPSDFEDMAYDLWESTGCAGFSINHTSDFDAGDPEIDVIDIDDVFEFYKHEQAKS